MKQFLFLLISSLFLISCSNRFDPVYVEGGPLAGGWWLITLIFGILLPGWLIYQGKGHAKKGKSWVDEKGKRHYDNIPQPWYTSSYSIMGLVCAAIIWVITIARIASWS